VPYKRIGLAALVLLFVIYLKLFHPSFAGEAVPAIRSALAEQQAVLYLPESWIERLEPG
jgi:hypothetical protein